MADRRGRPKQSNSRTANAAMFVVAFFFALPAAAVTTGQVPCVELTQTTLVVSAVNYEALTTPIDDAASSRTEETSNSASLLAPRAEAAIREIFSETERTSSTSDRALIKAVLTLPIAGIDSKTEPASNAESNSESNQPPATDMKTRLPGISDDDLSLYKKRMFRRDI